MEAENKGGGRRFIFFVYGFQRWRIWWYPGIVHGFEDVSGGGGERRGNPFEAYSTTIPNIPISKLSDSLTL